MMNSFFKSPKALIIIPLMVVWLAGLPALVPYNSNSPVVPSMELGESIYRMQQLVQTVQTEDAFSYQFNQAVEAIVVTAGLKVRFQASETVYNPNFFNWNYLPSFNMNYTSFLSHHSVVMQTVSFESIPSYPPTPPPRFPMV